MVALGAFKKLKQEDYHKFKAMQEVSDQSNMRFSQNIDKIFKI